MGCSCKNNLKNENEKEVLNEFEVNNNFQETTKNPKELNDILTDNNIKRDTNHDSIKSDLRKNSEIMFQNQISERETKSKLKEKPKKNINKNSNIYKSITTNEMTKEELEKFFNEYAPLNDGIKVELRTPQLCENGTIYYGEWDVEKNFRHGRGIQIWPNKEKYIGYWKNNHSN